MCIDTERVSVCIERRAVSEPSSPTHPFLHLSFSLSDISPFSSNHFLPFGPLFFLMQLSLIPPSLPLSLFHCFYPCLPIVTFLFHFVKFWDLFFSFLHYLDQSCSGSQQCVYYCQLYLLFLLVCSYLALSFVLLFSDQSSIATVCDKKVLINQYHSPNVITFFSEPL